MTATLPPPTYALRDYQQELVQQVFAEWQRGNHRVMLQLPTGGGKTVLFSATAREFTNKGGCVLVLAHREELLLQARDKLEAVTGLPVGIIKSGYPISPLFYIQVASIQTLVRRQYLPEASLVICDEAHHSCSRSYTKIFECYQQSYILGVTATPARVDGQAFKFLYDHLVLGPSVAELIAADHLCKFKLFAAQHRIDTSNVRTTAGDFNQRDLAVAANGIMGNLVDTWRKYAAGKRTVVFAVDVAHSQAIALSYQEVGIAAEHLDGETPTDERRAILERFRTGETLVLCNCGIVSEGFDLPLIEAIQCARPTKSLVLWLQMVGRALRPAPGKDYALLIDHTQNWIEHGLPDDERKWSLEPVSLTERQWAVDCPECQHVFKPLPHELANLRASCPNCNSLVELRSGEGGEAPPPRTIVQDDSKELELVDFAVNPRMILELHRLRALQQQRGYHRGWVYHQLVEKFPNFRLVDLCECASLLGYKPGWVWYKWQELTQRRELLCSTQESFSSKSNNYEVTNDCN